MIDLQQAIQMKKDGLSYKDIGDRFGVSRQRAQQKLRTSFGTRPYTRKSAPNKYEQRAIGILRELDITVEPATERSFCDLYVLGKPVEVKFVSPLRKVKKIVIYNLEEVKAVFLFIGEEWFLIPSTLLTKKPTFCYPPINNGKYARILRRYKTPSHWKIRNILLGKTGTCN